MYQNSIYSISYCFCTFWYCSSFLVRMSVYSSIYPSACLSVRQYLIRFHLSLSDLLLLVYPSLFNTFRFYPIHVHLPFSPSPTLLPLPPPHHIHLSFLRSLPLYHLLILNYIFLLVNFLLFLLLFSLKESDPYLPGEEICPHEDEPLCWQHQHK